MININGKTYRGNNIVINNNQVIIDGKNVTDDHEGKLINIVVNGNIDTLDVDFANEITVNGDAGSVKTTNGDITCRNVKAGVGTTNGDVECENIGGDVTTTNGDVDAKQIHGSVKSKNGDIKHR